MTRQQANLIMGFCVFSVIFLGGIFGSIIGSGGIENYIIVGVASIGACVTRSTLLETIKELKDSSAAPSSSSN